MWNWILNILLLNLMIQQYGGKNVNELAQEALREVYKEKTLIENDQKRSTSFYLQQATPTTKEIRRYWMTNDRNIKNSVNIRSGDTDEEAKDLNLKEKIATLVEQTMHDTSRKIKSIHHTKENNRDKEPYKIGFILSMVKKSRDVLNELFNVAVKHRDEWKALEQLKIFELIVHTNVDTTHLVRQLVEIHIQHLNATANTKTRSRRVVLI